MERRFAGEAPPSVESGTKHFPPKTKVYCFPAQWGDGYEKIVVIGRHRGSHRYVRMVIPSRHVTHWRMKQVYSPKVLRLIKDGRQHFWKGKQDVEQALRYLLQRDIAEAAKRPPLN